MANRNIFKSSSGPTLPGTTTVNNAGGTAYTHSDEHALAQYAVTGCLNGTYYATAEMEFDTVVKLANKVDPKFLAQVAVYAREKGLMKDMPALLLAILSTRDIGLTKSVFTRVCDDAKMVKNFVQIIRSGKVGRKSLGTALKRCVQNWLESRTEEQLFKAVVGTDPSLSDIIKMVHPKPKNKTRENFYRYLVGKKLTEAETATLPEEVRDYEAFKANPNGKVPNVPFLLLTNLKLNTKQYQEVAANMSWAALRQNLNALSRNGVFDAFKSKAAPEAIKLAATKLGDAEQVRRAKAFPFQLYAAYNATASNSAVPAEITNALQDALDASLSNVPELEGKTYVAVDVSPSMSAPATGNRGSATSTVSCLDAAAVMGSAMLRRNPNQAEIIPFSDDVHVQTPTVDRYGRRQLGGGTKIVFNSRDSIMTNVHLLQCIPSSGTNCSSVLEHLNRIGVKGASAVVYLSDNESWIDSGHAGQATKTMTAWNEFRRNNPKAKLVCVDFHPGNTTQASERPDVLNVGGFSDSVFTVIDLFLKNDLTSEHWVGIIKSIEV